MKNIAFNINLKKLVFLNQSSSLSKTSNKALKNFLISMKFYEDFCRVAVQNKRYEDWSNVLVHLRKLFTDYQKIVLEYH